MRQQTHGRPIKRDWERGLREKSTGVHERRWPALTVFFYAKRVVPYKDASLLRLEHRNNLATSITDSLIFFSALFNIYDF